jgi:hypothetical protein
MAGFLTFDSSQQYTVDSALTASTRGDIDAYLAALTLSNARELIAAINRILPVVSARVDAMAQELKSTGLISADTTAYAQEINQEILDLSFDNINTLLTRSANNSVAAASAKQVFLDDNFELLKQYTFKKSRSDFYLKYSAHLQDRGERLANDLQTLTIVHDNLTMILEKAQSKIPQ